MILLYTSPISVSCTSRDCSLSYFIHKKILKFMPKNCSYTFKWRSNWQQTRDMIFTVWQWIFPTPEVFWERAKFSSNWLCVAVAEGAENFCKIHYHSELQLPRSSSLCRQNGRKVLTIMGCCKHQTSRAPRQAEFSILQHIFCNSFHIRVVISESWWIVVHSRNDM